MGNPGANQQRASRMITDMKLAMHGMGVQKPDSWTDPISCRKPLQDTQHNSTAGFLTRQQISPSRSFGSFESCLILSCATLFTFLRSIPNVNRRAMHAAASAKTNTPLSAAAYASRNARRVCGRTASDWRFEAPAFMISAGEMEDVRRDISVRRLDSKRA